MDEAGGWRLVEPDTQAEAGADKRKKPEAQHDGLPRPLMAALAALVLGAVALAVWMTLPTSGGVSVDAGAGQAARVVDHAAPAAERGAPAVGGAPDATGSGLTQPAGAPVALLVVDLEGAVVRPGVHQLPDGSRVADAIEAAGGYASNVALAAVQATLNLAARITDGQQIHVPALGEAAAPPTPAAGDAAGKGTAGTGTSSLIDVNHATADELDTLPGIGPVTAAKIIDARTEAPFGSVDELQSRGVVGPSTFEKLRALVTVTP